MKYIAIPFLVAMILTGCASLITPEPRVVVKPEVVTVDRAVVSKCIESLPLPPFLAVMPTEGIVDQTLARIRREEALQLYITELRILMEPCVKKASADAPAKVEPGLKLTPALGDKR